MLRLLNVATPATAGLLTVPPSCAPAVPVPVVMAALTLADEAVRLPLASRIRTVTAGEIVAPPVVAVGCCPNASFAAAPTVMLKLPEVALLSPVDEAVRV